MAQVAPLELKEELPDLTNPDGMLKETDSGVGVPMYDITLPEPQPPKPPEPIEYHNITHSFDTESLQFQTDLHQCARNGYLDLARVLLRDPAVVAVIDAKDDEELTALHYAARYNHAGIVRLLVEKGADIACKGDDGLTPLHYACRIKRKRKKLKRMNTNTPSKSPGHMSIIDESLINDTVHVLKRNGAKLDARDDYEQTPLHHAALRGDEVACEQLLSYQSEVDLINTKDSQLMTPLHTAATQNQPEIVKMLIEAGADMRSLDEEESTPLHEAATAGNVKVAKIMFTACTKDKSEKGTQLLSAMLDDKDEDGNTPLMLAIESGRYHFTQLCIDKGAKLNKHNNQHLSTLHLAAINGDVRIVRLLIQKGAKIEALTYELATPLHKAAQFNNRDCVESLIDTKAFIEAKDKDNFTPLLIAVSFGHVKTVQLLLDKGADVTVEDKMDRSVVYWAAFENHADVLESLLRNPNVRQLINDKDQNNNGPLHIGAYLGHLRIVKCLLDNGADLYSKNDEEQTPIHKAAFNGWPNVVREIVGREKNSINDGDEDSNTAIHLAATKGHVHLVEVLLDLGADVTVKNSSLRTPLGCAAAAGFPKTVKLFIEADSPIDNVDKMKLTPLLLAAKGGHANVVDLLLKRKANVKYVDTSGHNCLDLAIDNDNQDVAMEIVKSDYWKETLRCTQRNPNGSFDTPIRKLIRKMPEVASEVFDRCINMKKPDEESERYEITFDFEFLDDLYNLTDWEHDTGKVKKPVPAYGLQNIGLHNIFTQPKHSDGTELVPYTKDSETFRKYHPMVIMVTSNREELLGHPLVTALLHYKWASFGRLFYYINFITYIIFLAFLTGFVIVTLPPYQIPEANCEGYQATGATQHVFARVGKIFILVLAFLNIIKEIFQGYHGKMNYITWENLLEVLMYLSTVIFVLDHDDCQRVTGYRSDWQWNFGTLAIFLAWIELILFFRKFPEVGIYIVMFQHILHTFFQFFLVFALFIIAFGLGFFCLLQNQTPYSTPWNAIIKTTVMMIGEYDYDTIFHESDVPYFTTYILFVIFVVIMSIIIMNLLVGLAVDDIKGVQDQSALKRIAMKVFLVLDVERILSFLSRRYYKMEVTIYRKTLDSAMAEITPPEGFENQIQKSQQRILKKTDKLKHLYKDLKRDLDAIKDMVELITKAQKINVITED